MRNLFAFLKRLPREEIWQELVKALKEEKMHRMGKLIFFLARLFRRSQRRMVGWAPVGKIYVCPACDRTRQTRGFCQHDGEWLVLRDEPMCPNGHPQAVLGLYPKTSRYCHVCGAENPGEETSSMGGGLTHENRTHSTG